MPSYTQKELLEKEFRKLESGILDGLLVTGLYLFGATSKVGKTMIATTLANAVANGKEYLGKRNKIGKVIYFDNDNYEFEAKRRIEALELSESENITYYFGEEAMSLRVIKNELSWIEDQLADVSLIIIDCFINLSEFSNEDPSFQMDYSKIKEFRDFIVKKNLVCIILHHTKKGIAVGQDRLLGSKAMSAATTGTIILDVADEFSKIGRLEFILRHKKEIISIKKDERDIGWDVSNDIEDEVPENIPRNILFLINKLVSLKEHKIVASCQEIVALTGMDVNPKGLYRYLVKYEKYLTSNHVLFRRDKKCGERVIEIEYNADDGQ